MMLQKKKKKKIFHELILPAYKPSYIQLLFIKAFTYSIFTTFNVPYAIYDFLRAEEFYSFLTQKIEALLSIFLESQTKTFVLLVQPSINIPWTLIYSLFGSKMSYINYNHDSLSERLSRVDLKTVDENGIDLNGYLRSTGAVYYPYPPGLAAFFFSSISELNVEGKNSN